MSIHVKSCQKKYQPANDSGPKPRKQSKPPTKNSVPQKNGGPKHMQQTRHKNKRQAGMISLQKTAALTIFTSTQGKKLAPTDFRSLTENGIYSFVCIRQGFY